MPECGRLVGHHRTRLDQPEEGDHGRARDRLHLLGRGQRLHRALRSVCEEHPRHISEQDHHCKFLLVLLVVLLLKVVASSSHVLINMTHFYVGWQCCYR